MRRKLFLVLLLALGLTSKAVVRTDSVESRILGTWVKFNVYCPNGYDSTGDKHYPVLYLLHGLSDTYVSWNNNARLGDVADELLAEGKIREMIIVMPNAGGPDTRNIWNGYFNMPGWSYEDFFFKEFMPAVEKRYHVKSAKGCRAISGLSMGGGGSTVYCQKHPEAFSSCYAMSAWLDDSRSIQEATVNKLHHVVNAVRENSAIKFVESADEAALEKLRDIKWYFDVGDDDFLLDQTERLHLLMRSKRVKARLRVREGAHNWLFWKAALYESLPFASRNFE